MEVVIHTDQERQVYVPSPIVRRSWSESAPAQPAAASDAPDPIEEALRLIRDDMKQRLQTPDSKDLENSCSHLTIDLGPALAAVSRVDSRPPEPPRAAPPRREPDSIFDDDFEKFRVRARRYGGRQMSDHYGELLALQRVVQHQQDRLREQVKEMHTREAEEEAEEEEAARLRRLRGSSTLTPQEPGFDSVAATTARQAFLTLLREESSEPLSQTRCNAAVLCLSPRGLPAARRMLHALRCEVLELRALLLRATVDKNKLAIQLNSDRARLRATFTSAQLKRLLGLSLKGSWASEDLRRAIALRRVMSQRQYRHVQNTLGIPLPALRFNAELPRVDQETHRLYQQLVGVGESRYSVAGSGTSDRGSTSARRGSVAGRLPRLVPRPRARRLITLRGEPRSADSPDDPMLRSPVSPPAKRSSAYDRASWTLLAPKPDESAADGSPLVIRVMPPNMEGLTYYPEL